MSRILIRLAIVALALALFGFLFIRSVRNIQSTPYTVSAEHLTPWTLALESPATQSGPLLVLRAPTGFASHLFSQIFSRMSESLSGPRAASMALILRGEFERALAGDTTPEALLALAREAGLESASPTPRCLVTRRISAPGITRQMFAVVFDVPAFGAFRQRVAERWPGPAAVGTFDAGALSPTVLVAATDASFDSWHPIRVEPASDCLAPIEIE